MKRLVVVLAWVAMFAAAESAAAQQTVLGGALTCTSVAGGDYALCRGGFVPSWDGTPLSVDVYLPPGAAGPRPLVALLTGYPAGRAGNFRNWIWSTPAEWARRGYAVLTLAPRGMTDSCGPQVTLERPDTCQGVESHLADSRYEARDVQHLAGVLADEGVVAAAIGVVGESYGGGTALQLAVLADRVHLPDGSFAEWRSPAGRRMRIGAAAPLTTWSDLAYALVKNGRARDDRVVADGTGAGPVGIPLTSYFTAFTAVGIPDVSNGPASQSSLARWWAAMNAGEPFATADEPMADFATFHSSHGIPLDGRPAPTLLASGLTDDLFPVQEALRHVHRVRSMPGVKLAQVHGEFGGHGRTMHNETHASILRARTSAFFDRHLRGDEHAAAPSGVEVLVPSCDAANGETRRAREWGGLSDDAVFVRSVAPQVVAGGGDPLLGRALEPAAVGVPRCTAQGASDQTGVATYRSAPFGPAGALLIGSPEVTATMTVAGAPVRYAQVAARLWDVDPATGTQRLVTRTLYRPRGSVSESFQLHGTAYRFAPGHVAKLELLAEDAPYGRPSNLPFAVEVSALSLRLPVG